MTGGVVVAGVLVRSVGAVHVSSAGGFSRLSAGIRRRVPIGVGRRGVGSAACLRFSWIPSRIR